MRLHEWEFRLGVGAAPGRAATGQGNRAPHRRRLQSSSCCVSTGLGELGSPIQPAGGWSPRRRCAYDKEHDLVETQTPPA